jgi:hypothetical protein
MGHEDTGRGKVGERGFEPPASRTQIIQVSFRTIVPTATVLRQPCGRWFFESVRTVVQPITFAPSQLSPAVIYYSHSTIGEASSPVYRKR